MAGHCDCALRHTTLRPAVQATSVIIVSYVVRLYSRLDPSTERLYYSNGQNSKTRSIISIHCAVPRPTQSGHPSLEIRGESCWVVNRHTRDAPVPYPWFCSVNWRIGWGLRKRRSAPLYASTLWFEKDYVFFTDFDNNIKTILYATVRIRRCNR